MTQIIDGRKIRDEILAKVKHGVSFLSFVPVFCDVLVGEDPSSVQYVNMKAKTAESLGMKFHRATFGASITTEELVKEIEALNKVPNMCGIIIQLPLPTHIDKRTVLDAIDPKLDVDCLGTVAGEKFYSGFQEGDLGLPTALACMEILDSVGVSVAGKNVLVLGQGDLVGKPVTALLRSRGVEPKMLTRKTEDKDVLFKEADILISGMGNGLHITGDMIKEGAVLIDAGTSEMDGGIVGDVDVDLVQGVASYVSPVPGGVGPVTVACLLRNVLNVANKLK